MLNKPSPPTTSTRRSVSLAEQRGATVPPWIGRERGLLTPFPFLVCMCVFLRSPWGWQSPVASLGDPCLSLTPLQHLSLLFEPSLPFFARTSPFHCLFYLHPSVLNVPSFTAADIFSAPSHSLLVCSRSVSCFVSPSHSLSVCLALSLLLSCIHIAMETGSCSSLQHPFFSLSPSCEKKIPCPPPPPLLLSFHAVLLRPVLFSLSCCQGEATYLTVLHIYWFMKLVVSMVWH